MNTKKPAGESRPVLKVCPNQTNIQEQILDARAQCMKNDREPILIIIHPELLLKLIKELECKYGKSYAVYFLENSTYMGMQIITSFKVPDFQVVDNRSWIECQRE